MPSTAAGFPFNHPRERRHNRAAPTKTAAAGPPFLASIKRLRLVINLGAFFLELDGLFFHALVERSLFIDTLRRGVVAHILGDFHRAEMRPAHRAEMRELGALLRQRLVVEFLRLVRIEAEIELVVPAKLEARLRQRVVANLRARMTFGEIGRMRRDLVRHDAVLDVVLVRQPEMLLRRHVAQHRRAVPADHRGADGAGDVVVAGGDVGGQRAQGVERGLVADLQLQVHVLLDLVHRHMAGALDHHLAALVPRDLREFAERLQLRELRAVVGVGDRAGAQAVAQ